MKSHHRSVLPIVITCALLIFLSNAYVSASSSYHPKTPTSTRVHEKHDGDNAESKESNLSNNKKKLKLIQVQVIHRHGDRTPITPMKDEEFWRNTLPPQSLLSKIAIGTTIKRDKDQSQGTNHAAGGRGSFGKLTQLGLLQMVEVGSRLREELHLNEEDNDDDDDNYHIDDHGNIHLQKGRLFTKQSPLHPSKIKVKSTDFPRTLQSVQALLVGLFPDGLPEGTEIEIDASHTDILIPDPQPRTSREQVELEKVLSSREYLMKKENEVRSLANKLSQDLKPFLSAEANSVVYGIGEEGDTKVQDRPLAWSQLSEIMTCLKVREMLPETISEEEYETATKHAAWKWFENLRHDKLAYLAMKPFMNFIMNTLNHGQKHSDQAICNNEEDCKLHIYSAHDSSLIGLICAFRLQQPSNWPEYGSYLKIELFEACDIKEENKEYFVRFSLNNNILRSTWGVGEGDYKEPMDMIPLYHLDSSIMNEHGH